MNNVYSFLKSSLESFSDRDIYDKCIKKHCLILNELLNNVKENDYSNYLKTKEKDILLEIQHLFIDINSNNSLEINLCSTFNMINEYQNFHEFSKESENYIRDHFYHSVQCFLLSIALYNHFSKLVPANLKIEEPIIFLFEITFYHDLGYLYQVDEYDNCRINKSFLNFFKNYGQNQLSDNELFDILCIKKDFIKDWVKKEEYSVIDEKLTEAIKKIATIWDENVNENDKQFLSQQLNVRQFPHNYEKHHSFFSAILIHRLYRSKLSILSIIEDINNPDMEELSICKTENNKFLECIKTILYHDFKIVEKMSLSDNFWPCFLMIIDELQSYGRVFQNTQKNTLILHPAHVGFILKDDRLGLEIDENYCSQLPSETIIKKYKKHSNEELFKVLSEKMNETAIKSFLK